jgi:hypothetical protein
MESGFIVDRGDGGATQEQEWVEGAVVKTFWRGVHTHDREKATVATYRCTRCGYLESYATGQ